MKRVTFLRGVSGSGKSTIARAHASRRENKCVVVNRDKIRELLFGSESDYGVDEELVSVVEKNLLSAALCAGYNVISDNTNINPEYIKQLAYVANLCGVSNDDISIIVVDVPLPTALERNAGRVRKVPEHVIEHQWNKLQESKDFKL